MLRPEEGMGSHDAAPFHPLDAAGKELGPGSVLSGLVRKICNGKRPYAVSNSQELLAAADYLRSGGNAR